MPISAYLKKAEAWKMFVVSRRKYVELLTSHPLLLIFASALYAIATFAAAFLAAFLTILSLELIKWVFGLKEVDFEVFNSFFRFYFLILAACVWIDYLYLTIRSFATLEAIQSLTSPILRVIQLIATTVFIFAAAHYYVALFSSEKAYEGIDPPRPKYSWDAWNVEDKLMAVPSFETVVNCIYFSTITTATVGYGDVYPKSPTARIMTIVQVIFSFGIVVVLLGWVISNSDKFLEAAKKKGGAEAPPEG
jgi:hypothetical protein